MVQLKGTSKYPCKAGTVVFFAVTGCVLGLGEMAVAVWLLVVTLNFYELLGFVIHNVYIGYACVGGYHGVSCAYGICVSILRNGNGLLMFGVLMLASVLSHSAVWVFLFLQRNKVSAALAERVVESLPALGRQFPECNVNATEAVELCADAVHSWYWLTVWILLGVSAAVIVTAFLLSVTALLLRKLVKKAVKNTQSRIIEVQPLSATNRTADIGGVAPSREVQREMWLREPLAMSGSPPAEGGGACYHGYGAPPPQCNCVCHNYEVNDPPTKVHRTMVDLV